MRILMAHNYYQQAGGEDSGFRAETKLLQQHGHEVVTYTDTNQRINKMNKVVVAQQMIWSGPTQQKLKTLIQEFQPDVVHFHNTFMMISPAAYHLCHSLGVPVIRTVQNYRHSCLNSFLFRNNQVCEDCLNKAIPLPGIIHACYRDSHIQSLAVASMLVTHRALGTWQKQVDRFITVTNFMREKLIEAGLPAEKIVIKPNFSDLKSENPNATGSYVLFLGRFSAEKGVMTLLRAWQKLSTPIPLIMLGDGPLWNEVQQFIATYQLQNIKVIGWKQREEVVRYMEEASFLVQPSIWYEGFPMTIVEAYGCGLPVIASKLGSMAEVVSDGQTGLHFQMGDADDLASKVSWAWQNQEALALMSENARRLFQERYTPEQNYQMLMNIYKQVARS